MGTFLWCLGRMGVYVGDRDVRVQYFVGSDVVDWPDVRRFVVRTSRRGWIITSGWEEIWVVRRTGDPIETPLARVTDGPVRDLLPLRPRYVPHMGDDKFEQAFSHLEDARIRYAGRASV